MNSSILLMQSLYNQSKFSNARKLEIAEQFLNAKEKEERLIRANITNLKVIVRKIKGNIIGNVSHDNSFSIQTPVKTYFDYEIKNR